MGAVVWINGPFSSGKSSVAKRLVNVLTTAFLLDPERIGVTLRDHLVPPCLYPGDFQDLPLWRVFTRDAVLDAADRYDGTVVVPMTIAQSDYFAETVEAIRKRVPVHHFTLMASRAEILRREAVRPDDTGGWAAKTVDRILPELADARYAEHLDSERHSVDELVSLIRSQMKAG
jgi:chloramphenicol 3-O-phosphotransferase